MTNSLSPPADTRFEGSPLRNPSFRLFYLGSIATALGYTLQSTVAAWLMTTLSSSPLLISLVQTASAFPALLFGLVAGTLADIVDRHRIVLVTQILLLGGTAILGLATLVGIVGSSTLLFVTFLIGTGFTFYLPAQQASINDLVSRAQLPHALGLGAAAFNVARAIGPAIAGAITAGFGSGSALLASAVCFTPMIVAVRRLKSAGPSIPGVPERMLSGILSGLRYARHSSAMRSLLIRNLSFSICASALWALMPVIAREQLRLGAGGFGLLMGSFGTGAVLAALFLLRRLRRVSLNTGVTLGVLLWTGATLLIAATSLTALALAGAGVAGIAWIVVLASISSGTQSNAPGWVRSRAVSMYLMAMQGSLALGSPIWGALASWVGMRIALAASAALMLGLLALTRSVRIEPGTEADVSSVLQLPDLAIAVEPSPEDGPVLIQVEYQVDEENRASFVRAIHDVEPARRRNGAISWRVFRDLQEDGRFVERFIIPSWAEYIRLRVRMTQADQQLQDRIERLLRGPSRISRLIGVNPEDAPAVPRGAMD